MADVTKIFVKPAPGHMVRDPQTRQFLPKEGGWVPRVDAWGRWWTRRIRDGSVVQAEPPRKEEPEMKREYVAPKSELKRKRTKRED